MKPVEPFLENVAGGFDLERVTMGLREYAKTLDPKIKVDSVSRPIKRNVPGAPGLDYDAPQAVRFVFKYNNAEEGYSDDEPSGLTFELAKQVLDRFYRDER